MRDAQIKGRLKGFNIMTDEQLIAGKRKGGQRTAELGVGVHGLSDEQRTANAHKGYKSGIGNMTDEQIVARNRKIHAAWWESMSQRDRDAHLQKMRAAKKKKGEARNG